MTPEHLKTLTETLAALKPLHARLDAVADELQRARDDQSGEWRFSAEGDAAGEELNGLWELVRHIGEASEELRQFVFLLSDNPDFATVLGKERGRPAPLPRGSSEWKEARAKPRRPGAPPYPFLKRPEDDAGPGPRPEPDPGS
jgi:hypothetical protein